MKLHDITAVDGNAQGWQTSHNLHAGASLPYYECCCGSFDLQVLLSTRSRYVLCRIPQALARFHVMAGRKTKAVTPPDPLHWNCTTSARGNLDRGSTETETKIRWQLGFENGTQHKA